MGNFEQFSSKFSSMLTTAIVETFEQLAFCESEGKPNTDLSAIKNPISMAMDTHDPCMGLFVVHASRPLAMDITHTILREPHATVTEEMLEDAVGEILNTVAGRLFRQMVDDDCSFDLGLPTKLSADLLQGFKRVHMQVFQVEQELMAVEYYTK